MALAVIRLELRQAERVVQVGASIEVAAMLRLAREGVVPGQKLGREWRFIRSDVRASISSGIEEENLEKLLSKFGAKITPGRRRAG